MRHHCTPKKIGFCAVYGPAASLSHVSFVGIKTGTLLLMDMVTAHVRKRTNFFLVPL